MAVFTISDLHLSFSTDKPMNVFVGWDNYVERIKANWNRLVKPEDTVIIPGDLSWGLKLEETLKDFLFLESLPGKKILLKGNHDLWWGTAKKVKEFLEKNNIKTVEILFNNAYEVENFAIAGTRGWFYDEAPDNKIIMREVGRLKTSLESAKAFNKEIIVFLHYPFAYGDYLCEEIYGVLKEYNIKRVYYGHIHGAGRNHAPREYGGIKTTIVSCDNIDFTPLQIVPEKNI